MSLLLQQQEQTLLSRLAMISPLWASVIRRRQNGGLYVPRDSEVAVVNGRLLMLSSARYCIVGEAHGFSNRYFSNKYFDDEYKYCPDCEMYSNGLYMPRYRDGKSFETELKNFVGHFEECHSHFTQP